MRQEFSYTCTSVIVPHENQHVIAKVGWMIFTTKSLVEIQLWAVFKKAIKPNILYSDTCKPLLN